MSPNRRNRDKDEEGKIGSTSQGKYPSSLRDTGCRILVTLIYEMERRDLNLGIASLCAGGGVGTAILVER